MCRKALDSNIKVMFFFTGKAILYSQSCRYRSVAPNITRQRIQSIKLYYGINWVL